MYHVEQGISVVLGLAPDSQTSKFLNDLPRGLGHPVSPGTLHTAVMCPEEIARAGLGAPEIDKLPETANAIMSRLGDMCIIGRQLHTMKGLLWPCGKLMTIKLVDDGNICNDVRSAVSDVVADRLNVSLPTYLDSHHATISERGRSHGRRAAINYEKKFPSAFTIRECRVAVRSVGFTTDGQPQNYNNRLYRERLSSATR